jgi:putative redox protein
MHLLKDSAHEIAKNGKAKVNLGGADFTIKKQFLDDLENKPLKDVVRNFGKALLILHSPQDKTVSIQNAEDIYKAAYHPKSFVSLDGADHLLSKKEDSQYVGQVIAGWASRYVDIPNSNEVKSKSKVAASLNNDVNFTTHLKLGDHFFIADEPTSFGGNNFGPSPYEFLSAGLAACTVMTIQMYAGRKKWEVENVTCHINYSKDHAIDCEHCEEKSAKIDTFTREIQLVGKLSEEQKKRLLEIADKCPVHRTLHNETQVITTLIE